jgi:hypothetical protein
MTTKLMRDVAPVLLGLLCLSCLGATSNTPPNEVFMRVDGRGWQSIGSTGGRSVDADTVTIAVQGIRLRDGATGQSEVLTLFMTAIGEPEPGTTFTVRPDKPRASATFRNTGDPSTAHWFDAESGTISIRTLQGGVVTGTFALTFKQRNSDTRKTITEGRFRANLP